MKLESPHLERRSCASEDIEEQSELNLSALFSGWWQQRVRLLLIALTGFLVACVVVGTVYALRPREQQSSIVFRLQFKGAEKGEYPNGTRFTPAEIVSTPVLEEVYRRNQLESIVPFDVFKNAFAVINRNPALDRLRREYAGMLEDKRLSTTDRQKIEDDFESKTRAIRNGEYTLVAAYKGMRSGWPQVLSAKIMEDVLKTWAEQSRDRGVFQFDLAIYSESTLDDLSNYPGDYTLLLDRLRLTITRVLDSLDALGEIPGARLVRVGERQVSLAELQAALIDDLNFELKELNSMVYTFGLFRAPTLTEAYIQEQMFQLDLRRKELQSQNDAVGQILADYSNQGRATTSTDTRIAGVTGSSALSPQLSEGFLDRILNLSGQTADISFRQDAARQMIGNEKRIVALETERETYKRSLDSLAKRAVNESNVAQVKQTVDQKIETLLKRLRVRFGEVKLLHHQLSQQNLEPSRVYTVIDPIRQDVVSPVSLKTVLTLALVGWFAVLGAALVIIAWQSQQPRKGLTL